MTGSLAVCHGRFGRATLNRLRRPLASHAHREGHVIVTLRGSGDRIESQGSHLALERGRAVLIDPWRPHLFRPAPGGASEFLTLYIEPDWFSELAGRSLVFGASRVAMPCDLLELSDDLAVLMQASEDDDPTLPERQEAAVAELTTRLQAQSHSADEICEASDVTDIAGSVTSPRAISDFRIRRAVRLLRAAVDDEASSAVDLDAIARGAGLSRPHFFKLFQAHVGVTPGTYVNALKMERSYRRLATSGDSVTTIGLDLGFASQASFTRFFIAHSGIAPTQYRQAIASGGLPEDVKETMRYA